MSLSAGASLVLFSDGAVEQPDRAGAQFGIRGVLESLASCVKPDYPVGAIIHGVRAHARSGSARRRSDGRGAVDRLNANPVMKTEHCPNNSNI